MSVVEDGNEQEQPGETPQRADRADRAARHRVPPTASATAKVPVLPEPFNPAKPTFPAGAAIPRQRRGGPTAIATASIPLVPVTDDEPDTFFIGEPDADVVDLAPDEDLAPSDGDLPSADGDLPSSDDPAGVTSVFAGDGASVFAGDAGSGFAGDGASGDVADPATVGTLAGEVRASSAESPFDASAAGGPAVTVESPALVDPAVFAAAADPVTEVTAPDPQPVGVAPVVMMADDSPTVADYVPPAFAIVADEVEEDGPDYRGARRRAAPWRRYPIGAVAVAVLILLVTAAVVLQLVRTTDDNPVPAAADASPRYPGSLPELTRAAESPSTAPSSASPSPSRSKTSAPAVPPASAPASPSKSATTAAPPPLLTGQLRGTGSTKCLEYRSGENNRTVIDNCDPRGSGRTNQRWTFQSDGTVRADGACLDVQNAGTGNGNAVQVYACNGTPAQKWTLRADGTIVNPRSGRCLDVANGGTGAGNPVIIWDCSGAPNQKWTVQAY
jgi:hypothetical protein